MPPSETIDTVLDAFLHEQRLRLSERTYRNYEAVIRLLRDSLNSYAYSSLSDADATRWKEAVEAGDEEAFCHLFGPAKIPPHLGEFLGYFMVRKVIAGQELLKAAGTVTGSSCAGSRRRRISSPTRRRSHRCTRARAHGPCPRPSGPNSRHTSRPRSVPARPKKVDTNVDTLVRCGL